MSWNKDLAGSMCALLELFRSYQPSFSCSIATYDPAFLHTLHVALVVATDAISDCDKREVSVVKGIAMLSSKLDHALSELVVVLLLLHSVVESRMSEVFFSVGYEKLLKLAILYHNESHYVRPKRRGYARTIIYNHIALTSG